MSRRHSALSSPAGPAWNRAWRGTGLKSGSARAGWRGTPGRLISAWAGIGRCRETCRSRRARAGAVSARRRAAAAALPRRPDLLARQWIRCSPGPWPRRRRTGTPAASSSVTRWRRELSLARAARRLFGARTGRGSPAVRAGAVAGRVPEPTAGKSPADGRVGLAVLATAHGADRPGRNRRPGVRPRRRPCPAAAESDPQFWRRFTRIRAFSAPRPPGLWPFVSSVAFSRDGRTLAVGLTNETPASPRIIPAPQRPLWNVRPRGTGLPPWDPSGGPGAFSPRRDDVRRRRGVSALRNSPCGTRPPGKRDGRPRPTTRMASVEERSRSAPARNDARRSHDSMASLYLWSVPARRVVPPILVEMRHIERLPRLAFSPSRHDPSPPRARR